MKLIKNKVIKTLSIAMITCIATSTLTYAGTIPRVYLNGNKIFMQQSPFISEGTTYIPLRSTEQFGFTVQWDATTETVTLTDTKNKVVQKVGSKIANVNGNDVDLGAPAVKKGGSVYVPIRFVSNALGGTLEFDKKENIISVDFDINIAEGYGTDSFGRLIKLNTTPLGDTSQFLNYTPVGIPDTFYKVPLRYNLGTWLIKPVEGDDFIKPINIAQYDTYGFAKEEYMPWYREVAETYLNLILNVDYRTIDNSWAEAMANVNYPDPEASREHFYLPRLKEAQDYVKYIKDNKIIIEGDYFVEPSLLYYSHGNYYLRAKVKYKSNKQVRLFDYSGDQTIKGNVWHEGFSEIIIGSVFPVFNEGIGKSVGANLSNVTNLRN